MMSRITRQVSIPATHPALAGHFPGRPIVPGVVWLELAEEVAASDFGTSEGPRRWQRVRFVRAMGPGEELELEIEGDARAFSFRLKTSAGEPVASGQCRRGALE